MGRSSFQRANRRIAVMAVVVPIAGSAIGGQETGQFRERVRVERVILDARVLDDRGNPMLGLTADDFRVRIDGKGVRVETATWIGERNQQPEDAVPSQPSIASIPDAGAGLERSQPAFGRLVVFLVQKDLDRGRIEGLLQMLLRSRNFLATLTPADRVAILSFDSHLKIWTDFTNDRNRLEQVFARGLLFERPASTQAPASPSLMGRLSPDTAKHTYGIERALQLIGEALEPLSGAKSLVLVGHGFGRLGLSGMRMENDYEPARQALVASRTSVFSLDVTNADYHSLEVGLQLVADETGGFYERTHIFPGQAMRRLSGALAGYYVLFVERPERRRTSHDVSVTLARRDGVVFATSSYEER